MHWHSIFIANSSGMESKSKPISRSKISIKTIALLSGQNPTKSTTLAQKSIRRMVDIATALAYLTNHGIRWTRRAKFFQTRIFLTCFKPGNSNHSGVSLFFPAAKRTIVDPTNLPSQQNYEHSTHIVNHWQELLLSCDFFQVVFRIKNQIRWI